MKKTGSNIMTNARIQPFCRAKDINIGYYNEDRVFPRSVTNRDSALFSHDNHSCLIWKSEAVSFKQTIKNLEDIFKIADKYITNENVNCFFKYEFIPKGIESHLSKVTVYDLETRNTIRAGPNAISFHRLSKISWTI